jgi:hypothetical protein
MWFEMAYMATSLLILLYGETVCTNYWGIEAFDIYLLLLCNHVD